MSDTIIKKVQKRSGATVPFDFERITNAIHKAMLATESGDEKDARNVAKKVLTKLNKLAQKEDKEYIPQVETIQDLVEEELIVNEFS